jgi:hypothetical protein
MGSAPFHGVSPEEKPEHEYHEWTNHTNNNVALIRDIRKIRVIRINAIPISLLVAVIRKAPMPFAE